MTPTSRMIRWVLSLFTILVVAILVLGWPTLYRYDSLHDGKDITVYRTNRFTGSVAKLTDDYGWVYCNPPAKLTVEDGIPMTKEEVGKLSGDLSNVDGLLDGKVYNGNTFRVVEVSICAVELHEVKKALTEEQRAEVLVLPNGKEVKRYKESEGDRVRFGAERTFVVHTAIEPLSVRRIQVDAGLPANVGINGATGIIYAAKKAKQD